MKTARLRNLLAAVFPGVAAFALDVSAAGALMPDEGLAIAKKAYVFGFAVVECHQVLWAVPPDVFRTVE